MRLVVLACLAGCQIVFPVADGDAPVAPSDGADAPAECVEVGHDEDGDGLDDACDPCPQNAGAGDSDGDGVGDACDPQPATKCEQRLLFEGFGERPPLLLASAWLHDGDDMVHADSSTGVATMYFPGKTFSDVRVRVSATLLEFDPAATTNEFSLVSGTVVTDELPTTGYSCGITRTAGDVFDVQIKDIAKQTAQPGVFTGMASDTYTFEFVNRSTGELDCRAIGDLGQGQGLAQQVGAAMADGNVMILTEDVASRVHWIDVIANTCGR